MNGFVKIKRSKTYLLSVLASILSRQHANNLLMYFSKHLLTKDLQAV